MGGQGVIRRVPVGSGGRAGEGVLGQVVLGGGGRAGEGVLGQVALCVLVGLESLVFVAWVALNERLDLGPRLEYARPIAL